MAEEASLGAVILNIDKFSGGLSHLKKATLPEYPFPPDSSKDLDGYADTQSPPSAEEDAPKPRKKKSVSLNEALLAEPRIRTLKESSASVACSIHRVPQRFCVENENSYIPQIVSIGPFHFEKRGYDQQTLEEEKKCRYIKSIEEHKRRYLHDILARRDEGCLDRFLTEVKNYERKARECYSEEIDLDADSLVKMMVLDGCFIIELFRRAKEETNDPLIQLKWLRKHIAIDLLMLENQMPYFILQILFNLMNASSVCLQDMALEFFSFMLPTEDYSKQSTINPHHLLHLVHSRLLPLGNEIKKIQNPYPKIKMIPCAAELEAVGLLFRKREEQGKKNRGFLDIKFKHRIGLVSRGVIEIPPTIVSDVTGTLLLNLVAFEQCYCHCASFSTYFSGYIVFMDCLIATCKDVAILCNHGIDNCFGSNQHLVDLVNRIGGKLIIDDGDIRKTFDKINEHYEQIVRYPLRESFNRNCVKNPLVVISVFIAVVSLLTAIFFQLLFLILSHKK